MGTTAVFAELLVGGVLTLTWMGLLAMTVLGTERIGPLFNDSSLITGLLLAVAYALGVVFDRVWDFLLDVTGIHAWMRRQPWAAPESPVDLQRRRVFGADAKTAAEFVNYHRSRIRVARSSFFNFLLITLNGLTFLVVHFGRINTAEFWLAGTAGGLLCLASALALWKLSQTHDRVLGILTDVQEKTRSTH